MIVTVIGLEMPAIMRQPNGIECDKCGLRINFDRKDARHELDHLEEKGWKLENRITGAAAICPDCA